MSKSGDDLLSSTRVREALQSYTLLQPLRSFALQRALLDEIFTLNIEFDLDNRHAVDAALPTFFPRYDGLCELAVKRDRSIQGVTHWDLLQVIIHVCKGRTEPRHELEDLLRADAGLQHLNNEPNQLTRIPVLLDVAASIWLLMSIGNQPGTFTPSESIRWRGHESLYLDLIHRHIPPLSESSDLVKLPQTFTAAQLERIGGIEVRWTDNLAEHLLLKDDDSRLMLFHAVSVLELHVRSPTSSILPRELASETIRSIALLIPPVLGEANAWFQAERRRHRGIDAAAGVCERLNSSQRQIGNFVYWRDRLVLLKRTFDDAEPTSLAQLWHDDRKKTQWFTFWVAVLVFIMTVFFGVVQSIAGIVQAWASVKALNG